MAENVIDINKVVEEKQIEKENAKLDDEQEKHSKKEEKDVLLEDSINDWEAKFKNSEKEAKQNYDRFLRLSAEFENYKKRLSREVEDFKKFANESIIKDLLSVIDNFERAIESSTEVSQVPSTDRNCIVAGIDLTLKEILKVFKKYGVMQVESKGKPFDPNFHQALMREESDDYPENTVIKEMQKGYIMHNRLIRPAMVAVSIQKKKEEKE